MCGFVGAINIPVSQQIAEKKLKHRGPDQKNQWQNEFLQIFHFRLAIQRKTEGIQPIELENRYVLVFNGEIYNHRQLHAERLPMLPFRSDTETLLRIFIKYGEKCLDWIDGMFAFAVYDSIENTIFLGRDRAGKKPLYYFNNGTSFAFASELNCLSSIIPLEINRDHILQYLRLGYFYKKNTPYRCVYELEAGSCALFKLNDFTFQVNRWWAIEDQMLHPNKDSDNEVKEKIEAWLSQSIQRRIETSDREVGIFLSGGIDSGLIAALGVQYKPNIKTFTMAFDGACDENASAQKISNLLGTDHQVFNIPKGSPLADDVVNMLGGFGEPFFDSSAIPSWYLSQAAKKSVTVVLNGDGGDELFGGYRRYVPFAYHDFLARNTTRQSICSLLLKRLPTPKHQRSRFGFIHRLLELSTSDGLSTWLLAGHNVFEGSEQFLLSSGDYMMEINEAFDQLNKLQLSGLQKLMLLDFENILPGDLLVKMDIATMSHSMEARSPFLCKELLEYAPSLADRHKIHAGKTKPVLRHLFAKHLPTSLANLPKKGFEPPLRQWVQQDLRTVIRDYLSSPMGYSRTVLDSRFLELLINVKVELPVEKQIKMLWALFTLEIWYENYQSNQTFN